MQHLNTTMRSLALRLVPSLLLLSPLLVTGIALAQDGESDAPPGWDRFVRPVLDRGENGKAFFPVDSPGTGMTEVIDPRGFEVHMTPADDPGEERVFAAGEAFVPPSGRWRVWLQDEWRMTPSSLLVIWPTGRWRGTSPSTLAVAPAGRVTAPDAATMGADLELWLLFAGNSPGWRYHELSRRRRLAEAIDGVLMPAGPVVAALWDRRQERYIALSDEFTVVAGETVPVPLAIPSATEASVLVHTTVAPGVSPEALAAVDLTLSRDGQPLPSAFTVVTDWGVYRGWQAAKPGPAILSGGSELLYLDPRPVELSGGAVTGIEEALVARPVLEVSLVLPRLLREKPFTLEVRRLPGRESLSRAELPRHAGRHRFQDRLVNAVLEVELVTHVGSYRRQVDLTAGGEAFLGLEPELIEIYGTVRRNGERHPGTVSFQTVSGQRVTAAADEDGQYRAIALQPLTWVDVQLADVEQEPWRDFYMPPIQSSRELDFDIPDALTKVRVVDAVSGEGIAGAVVAVRNEYWPPDERETTGDARGRGTVIATSHPAGENGEVRLPPPRPGRVEIHAHAPGYLPLEQPIALDVEDPPSDRELEISLEPIGDAVRVHLTLPDGSPAAGASVLRVDSLALGTTFFSGRADALGVVEVPIEPAQGLLLLKHRGAAFGIIEWQAWKDSEDVEWVFPPAAHQPLTIRALDPAGAEPAAGAAVSLWVDDRKLSDRAMSWLLDATWRTDRNGYWTVHGLPRGPLRVLARSRHLDVEEEAGRLDALATQIPFPWPVQVEVRAVQ